jgi:hypothetical protein
VPILLLPTPQRQTVVVSAQRKTPQAHAAFAAKVIEAVTPVVDWVLGGEGIRLLAAQAGE